MVDEQVPKSDAVGGFQKEALSLMEAGRHLEAAELLKRASDSRYSPASLQGNIGLCYFRGGEFGKAIPYLRRSLEAEKNFGRLIQLGQAFLYVGRFKDAADVFAEGAEKEDDPVRALVWLARTYRDAGDLVKTRETIYDIASEHLSWNLPRERQIPFSHYPYFLQWVPGWTKLLQGTRIQHALEIGSMEGLSSIWMADQLLNGDGLLYCNDIHFRSEFRNNTRAADLDRPPVLLEGSSEFALINLKDGAFDFVYVDGDHRPEAVFQDGVNAIRCASPGGLVVFDDYLNRRNKTKESVDILLGMFKKSGEIISLGRQIVFRRNTDTVSSLEVNPGSGTVDWNLWRHDNLSGFAPENLLEYLSLKGRKVFSCCVQLQ